MVDWLRLPTPGIFNFPNACPTSACVTPSLMRRCLNRSAKLSNSRGSVSYSADALGMTVLLAPWIWFEPERINGNLIKHSLQSFFCVTQLRDKKTNLNPSNVPSSNWRVSPCSLDHFEIGELMAPIYTLLRSVQLSHKVPCTAPDPRANLSHCGRR